MTTATDIPALRRYLADLHTNRIGEARRHQDEQLRLSGRIDDLRAELNRNVTLYLDDCRRREAEIASVEAELSEAETQGKARG